MGDLLTNATLHQARYFGESHMDPPKLPELPPPTTSLITERLTPEQVELVTGKTRPSDQLKVLHSLGVVLALRHRDRGPVHVPRLHYEAVRTGIYGRVMTPPAPEPRWESMLPPRPPWNETPLGRWQQEERDAKRDAEARHAEWQAAQPKLTPAQQFSLDAERARESRLQKAATVRFHAAKRRVLKLQRRPAWADMDAIRAIYREAQRLTRETGISHHVDHEIPLQGKLVSGLHVHNNLQILTGSENSKKRNRFEVGP